MGKAQPGQVYKGVYLSKPLVLSAELTADAQKISFSRLVERALKLYLMTPPPKKENP